MSDHKIICDYLQEALDEMPDTVVYTDATTGIMDSQLNREKRQLLRILTDFRERNPWTLAKGYCTRAEQLALRVQELEAMIPQASQVLHRRNAELQRQLDASLVREAQLDQLLSGK
jgi:hypothetical protein